MITHKTGANAGLYQSLFKKANEALRKYYGKNLDGSDKFKKEDEISCVEDYFTYIRDLSNIDLLYTMLPLPVLDYDKEKADVTDEGAFKIDVITRTINTPKSFDPRFGKGCMAVQGDDIAEIVWFDIPRYIDSTDLNDPDMKIVIQWQGPLAPDGKTQLSGIRGNYYKNVTYHQGHILFGWPLDKEITKYPGTVKFAVRFFKTENYIDSSGDEKKRLIYSFSTLASSFIVQPSLDFDLINGNYDLENEDIQHQIFNRFVNSYPIQDDEIIPPAEPQIERDIVEHDNDIRDLGDSDNPLRLRIRATGDGLISYHWKRNGDEIKDSFIEFLRVEDATIQQGKVYYKKVKEKDGIAEHYEIADLMSVGDPINEPLYEAVSAYEPKATGIYQVEVQNRKGKSHSKTDGNHCNIPSPSIPIINNEYKNDRHYILGTETSDYFKIDNNAQIQFGDPATLTVTANLNDKDKDSRAYLSYQWYEKNNENNTMTIMTGENRNTLTVNNIGEYQVKVTSNRNGDKAVETSGTYIVSRLPVKVEFDSSLPNRYFSGKPVSAPIRNKDDIDQSGTIISYQWYKLNIDNDDELGGTPTIDVNTDSAIENATSESYTPASSDQYIYCKTTAQKNGIGIISYSPVLTIINRPSST